MIIKGEIYGLENVVYGIVDVRNKLDKAIVIVAAGIRHRKKVENKFSFCEMQESNLLILDE